MYTTVVILQVLDLYHYQLCIYIRVITDMEFSSINQLNRLNTEPSMYTFNYVESPNSIYVHTYIILDHLLPCLHYTHNH